MQNFFIANLTGEEIETLMQALGELPAKHTRVLMNKIEGQIVTQLKAASAPAENLGEVAGD